LAVTEPNNPPGGAPENSPRLSKEDRKNLLAELERASSRTETPEQVLQRAQQAAHSGNLAQARRLLDQVRAGSPNLPGLLSVQAVIDAGERQKKAQENLEATEEMLKRYIQQRKKQLAQFALQTFAEIAPQHPRLAEYRLWVKDLDQEVLMQDRINALLIAGRSALQAGNLEEAKKQLEALQKVDPTAASVEEFSLRVEAVDRGRAAGVGIDRAKKLIDEALGKRDIVAAQQALERLGALDVPKITLDFYAKRIGELRQKDLDQVDTKQLQAELEERLAARDWSTCREICRRFGDRFPNDPRATEMFQRVNMLEDRDRRGQAKDQGLKALEQYLAAGRKPEAELALKLLRSLNIEPDHMAALEARVRALP
jgi:hypothetical protein